MPLTQSNIAALARSLAAAWADDADPRRKLAGKEREYAAVSDALSSLQVSR